VLRREKLTPHNRRKTVTDPSPGTQTLAHKQIKGNGNPSPTRHRPVTDPSPTRHRPVTDPSPTPTRKETNMSAADTSPKPGLNPDLPTQWLTRGPTVSVELTALPFGRFGDNDDDLAANLLEHGLSVAIGFPVEMGHSTGKWFNRPGRHQGRGWHVDLDMDFQHTDDPAIQRYWEWHDRHKPQYTYPTPTEAAVAFLRNWLKAQTNARN